jgi:hypothetical protein
LEQLIQVAGAIAILSAFALSQAGRMDTNSSRYLALNLVGSAILAVQAALARELGFLLLEGIWAIVSIAGILRLLGSRES